MAPTKNRGFGKGNPLMAVEPASTHDIIIIANCPPLNCFQPLGSPDRFQSGLDTRSHARGIDGIKRNRVGREREAHRKGFMSYLTQYGVRSGTRNQGSPTLCRYLAYLLLRVYT